MTEIEKIIQQMNMTNNEFCREFNIPKRTLAHWIKGDRIPPSYVINLLRQVANRNQKISSEREKS